jgi:hypothetical protein
VTSRPWTATDRASADRDQPGLKCGQRRQQVLLVGAQCEIAIWAPAGVEHNDRRASRDQLLKRHRGLGRVVQREWLQRVPDRDNARRYSLLARLFDAAIENFNHLSREALGGGRLQLLRLLANGDSRSTSIDSGIDNGPQKLYR